jgi:hypothetical protein
MSEPPQWPTSHNLRAQQQPQPPPQWGAPPPAPTPSLQPPHTTPPVKDSRRNLIALGVIGIFIALFVGFGVGSSSSKPVEVTPESCVRALDLASEGFTAIGGGLQEMSTALATLDTDGMNTAADKIAAWQTAHQGQVQAASSDCRAKAR